MVTYRSVGILSYGPGYKASVLVDPGIAEFYRSLIPKWEPVALQLYAPHITVVRSKFETPTAGIWGAREGEKVEFSYEPVIYCDWFYFWLDAHSEQICQIREEMGLPPCRYGRDRHHISLGNVKDSYR